jgi:hypothetical protein
MSGHRSIVLADTERPVVSTPPTEPRPAMLPFPVVAAIARDLAIVLAVVVYVIDTL